MTEARRQLPNTQNNFLIADKTFKLVMLRNVLPLLPGCKSTPDIMQLWGLFIPKRTEVLARLAVGNTVSLKHCLLSRAMPIACV